MIRPEGKIGLGFLCALISLSQYSFMLVSDGERRNYFTPFSIACYFLFFLLTWVYARSKKIDPVKWLVPKKILRMWLLIWVVVVVVSYVIRAALVLDVARFHAFLPFNAFLAIVFATVGVVIVFGDEFLQPAGRILKFGRDAP